MQAELLKNRAKVKARWPFSKTQWARLEDASRLHPAFWREVVRLPSKRHVMKFAAATMAERRGLAHKEIATLSARREIEKKLCACPTLKKLLLDRLQLEENHLDYRTEMALGRLGLLPNFMTADTDYRVHTPPIWGILEKIVSHSKFREKVASLFSDKKKDIDGLFATFIDMAEIESDLAQYPKALKQYQDTVYGNNPIADLHFTVLGFLYYVQNAGIVVTEMKESNMTDDEAVSFLARADTPDRDAKLNFENEVDTWREGNSIPQELANDQGYMSSTDGFTREYGLTPQRDAVSSALLDTHIGLLSFFSRLGAPFSASLHEMLRIDGRVPDMSSNDAVYSIIELRDDMARNPQNYTLTRLINRLKAKYPSITLIPDSLISEAANVLDSPEGAKYLSDKLDELIQVAQVSQIDEQLKESVVKELKELRKTIPSVRYGDNHFWKRGVEIFVNMLNGKEKDLTGVYGLLGGFYVMGQRLDVKFMPEDMPTLVEAAYRFPHVYRRMCEAQIYDTTTGEMRWRYPKMREKIGLAWSYGLIPAF